MRETLRLARFFGITLPAPFMIFDSATLMSVVACSLLPPVIAVKAFLINVFIADLRAVLTLFFFALTLMRFFADL